MHKIILIFIFAFTLQTVHLYPLAISSKSKDIVLSLEAQQLASSKKLKTFVAALLAKESPQEQIALIREMQKHIKAGEHLESHITTIQRTFYDLFASLFGLEIPEELPRQIQAQKELETFLNMTNTSQLEQWLEKMLNMMPYASFMASAEIRFAPIALSLINLFKGQDLFSEDFLQTHPDSKLAQLIENSEHLAYQTPQEIASLYDQKEDIPQFFCQLPIPQKPSPQGFHWLDIGTSPKAEGSPTLNLLKETLDAYLPDTPISYYGIDVFYPVLKSTETEEQEGQYEALYPHIHSETGEQEHNGITYWNAQRSHFDVRSDSFLQTHSQTHPQKFDFISVAKTFHHLTEKYEDKELEDLEEPVPLMPLALDYEWLDGQGTPLKNPPLYSISLTQQKSLTNMLNHLNVGGYLFLELSRLKPLSENSNDDNFIIIRKSDEQKVQIFSSVIPYLTDPQKVFFEEYLLLNASSHWLFGGPGLYKRFFEPLGVSQEQVKQYIRWANFLAFRYQSLNHNFWKATKNAISTNNDPQKTLENVFEAWLNHVPQEDTLKQKLMEKIRSYSQKHQGKLLSSASENISGVSLVDHPHVQAGRIVQLAPGISLKHSYIPESLTYDFYHNAFVPELAKNFGRTFKPRSAPTLPEFVTNTPNLLFASCGHFSGGVHPSFLLIEQGQLLIRTAPSAREQEVQTLNGTFTFVILDEEQTNRFIDLEIVDSQLTSESQQKAQNIGQALQVPVLFRDSQDQRHTLKAWQDNQPIQANQELSYDPKERGCSVSLIGTNKNGQISIISLISGQDSMGKLLLKMSDIQEIIKDFRLKDVGLLGASGDVQQYALKPNFQDPFILGTPSPDSSDKNLQIRPLASILYLEAFGKSA